MSKEPLSTEEHQSNSNKLGGQTDGEAPTKQTPGRKGRARSNDLLGKDDPRHPEYGSESLPLLSDHLSEDYLWRQSLVTNPQQNKDGRRSRSGAKSESGGYNTLPTLPKIIEEEIRGLTATTTVFEARQLSPSPSRSNSPKNE